MRVEATQAAEDADESPVVNTETAPDTPAITVGVATDYIYGMSPLCCWKRYDDECGCNALAEARRSARTAGADEVASACKAQRSALEGRITTISLADSPRGAMGRVSAKAV